MLVELPKGDLHMFKTLVVASSLLFASIGFFASAATADEGNRGHFRADPRTTRDEMQAQMRRCAGLRDDHDRRACMQVARAAHRGT